MQINNYMQARVLHQPSFDIASIKWTSKAKLSTGLIGRRGSDVLVGRKKDKQQIIQITHTD